MSSFNPLSLSGKRFIVTGAASGMGRAAAIYLSKLEADVLLLDINQEQLAETQSKCDGRAHCICVDLTDTDSLKRAVLSNVEYFGKLNGFVHCAGIPYISPLKTLSAEKADRVYKINTYAGLELAKIFINKKVSSELGGSIVFISSVYGVVGSAANVGYALSKGAIQSMTRALAMELATKHIRVNCIAPGFVKTEMSDGINHNFDASYEQHIESLHPLGWGSPEDVAACIAYLFSDMSKWVTGAIFNIDGGFTAQ